MANNAFPYTPELKPFQESYDAWAAEVRRIFGDKAAHTHWTDLGKGEEGSTLRRLHDAREAARVAWYASGR